MRLDKWISEHHGLSRRAAQEAIRRGQVDVDGRRCLEPGTEVEGSSQVAFEPNRPRIGSASRLLDVLYEDRQILIANKPAGVLTQPTTQRERDTLLERAGRYLMRKRGFDQPYVGIVHRLDKDTTGVILLVISSGALRPFQAMFRDHAIERNYLAVVDGVFVTGSGRIDLPLVPDRGDGRRGVARQPGQGLPAVTHFEVLESFGRVASLVACRLETGRTHQIRIHLAEIGHPVVGDPVYRPRSLPKFPVPFRRQALHAVALGFVHPISGEALRVEAPLAADLTELVEELRHRFGGTGR
ncbi:MAG: RluA family pseudouridine synthase [Isosphaeraceae bacterium]